MASEPDVGGLVVDGELGGHVPVLGGGELGLPPGVDPCVLSGSQALPRTSDHQLVVARKASVGGSAPTRRLAQGKELPW